MRNGFKIVDTDCHLMEREWLWDGDIEPSFKKRPPKSGRAPESNRRTFLVEGESFVREKGKYPMAAPAFLSAVSKAMKRFDTAKADGFSAQSRLRDMDEQGVDVQIMYPTVAGQMLGREFRDIKLLAACTRAYNDWACDYASADPKRLKWAAGLPMQSVEEAMKKARRAADKGCITYYMRPTRAGAP